mmetsp:Transcript_28833/g.57648  ORF Transcript_28833/g.57648 Transcript_28833/m.57648 type:complete len:204 (-) Transcript_28833:577-1188(-)
MTRFHSASSLEMVERCSSFGIIVALYVLRVLSYWSFVLLACSSMESLIWLRSAWLLRVASCVVKSPTLTTSALSLSISRSNALDFLADWARRFSFSRTSSCDSFTRSSALFSISLFSLARSCRKRRTAFLYLPSCSSFSLVSSATLVVSSKTFRSPSLCCLSDSSYALSATPARLSRSSHLEPASFRAISSASHRELKMSTWA